MMDVLKDNQIPCRKPLSKVYVPLTGRHCTYFTYSVFSSVEKAREMLPDSFKNAALFPYILDPNFPTDKVYVLDIGNFVYVTNNPDEWYKLQKELRGRYGPLRGKFNDERDTIENNTLEVDSIVFFDEY